MLKRGNAAAHVLQELQVNISSDDCRVNLAFAQNFTPWRYDEAMSKSFAAVLVTAALRCGEDVGLSLDRPRTQ